MNISILYIYIYQPFTCFLEAQCISTQSRLSFPQTLKPRYPPGELWIISHRSQATAGNLKEIQKDTKDGLRFWIRIEVFCAHLSMNLFGFHPIGSQFMLIFQRSAPRCFAVGVVRAGLSSMIISCYLLYLTLPFHSEKPEERGIII